MIGWTTVNPVLLDVFRDCAIDRTRLAEGFNAEWKEGPRSFTHPHQNLTLLLKVTRVGGIGGDETRYEETTVDNVTTVRATQTGQRRVTLQVQAIVPAQTDAQWAMATLERIRMRLDSPAISDRLDAVEVALIDVGDAVEASFPDRGRMASCGTMDVQLGMVANEDDPLPSNWIQYLVISSHLYEGTELPTDLQMVNVEVPAIP